MVDDADIETLEAERSDLTLASFTHEDAWNLGSTIRAAAIDAGLGVIVDIRRATGAVLFHAALPGTTADNEDWLVRKAAVSFHFEEPSALVAARMFALGVPPGSSGWLDPTRFVLAGGAVPIFVEGAGVVAVVTVSGATAAQDHDLAVAGIRSLHSR